MKFACVRCQQWKVRSLFPKQNTSWCLACVREATAGRRAAETPQWSHGASGYQNHGCRCAVCRAAWTEKTHRAYLERQQRQAAPRLVSWWIEAPPTGFTAHVEAQELPRMRLSNLGQSRGRAISSDELNR